MPRRSLAGLIRRYLAGATLVRQVPISIVLAGGVALATWTHRLLTEGEKALLAARGLEVQADERRVQLVAVLISLASLLTRAGVEFSLARQAAKENDSVKPGASVR